MMRCVRVMALWWVGSTVLNPPVYQSTNQGACLGTWNNTVKAGDWQTISVKGQIVNILSVGHPPSAIGT